MGIFGEKGKKKATKGIGTNLNQSLAGSRPEIARDAKVASAITPAIVKEVAGLRAAMFTASRFEKGRSKAHRRNYTGRAAK